MDKGGFTVREYFPKVLGNRQSANRIGTAIENGTLSHALLIGGPSGSGKTVFATEIAAAVNCEGVGHEAALPCGVCSSCRRIFEGNFPDFKVLKKPSDRATLGVDPIKELREDMFLSSTEANTKIYVIDDAECMTPEAQNALLKVLEEPPGSILIILLARECDKILTTIKSRTQYVAMSRFTEDELKRILPARSQEAAQLMRSSPERFDAVIMSSEGRLGEALRLVNAKNADECKAQRDEVAALLRALRQGAPRAELYSAVMALQTSKRQELVNSIENVISAVRDLIAIQNADRVRLLFFTSAAEAKQVAEDIGISALVSLYDALCEAHEYCSKNANIANILTNLLARITVRE